MRPLWQQSLHGRWRVIYPDGQRSQRFDLRTALAYRAIFGGRVRWAGRPT